MSKKRKFTFNVIDALIILFLVALITFIVYFFVLGKSLDFNGEDNTNTEVTENIEQRTKNDNTILSDENIGQDLL